MIATDLRFETVLGGTVRTSHDAGIVDERIESIVLGQECLTKGANTGETGQIEPFRTATKRRRLGRVRHCDRPKSQWRPVAPIDEQFPNRNRYWHPSRS